MPGVLGAWEMLVGISRSRNEKRKERAAQEKTRFDQDMARQKLMQDQAEASQLQDFRQAQLKQKADEAEQQRLAQAARQQAAQEHQIRMKEIEAEMKGAVTPAQQAAINTKLAIAQQNYNARMAAIGAGATAKGLDQTPEGEWVRGEDWATKGAGAGGAGGKAPMYDLDLGEGVTVPSRQEPAQVLPSGQRMVPVMGPDGKPVINNGRPVLKMVPYAAPARPKAESSPVDLYQRDMSNLMQLRRQRANLVNQKVDYSATDQQHKQRQAEIDDLGRRIKIMQGALGKLIEEMPDYYKQAHQEAEKQAEVEDAMTSLTAGFSSRVNAGEAPKQVAEELTKTPEFRMLPDEVKRSVIESWKQLQLQRQQQPQQAEPKGFIDRLMGN